MEPAGNIGECEYCGTRQTVPADDNEKKTNLFNRAQRLFSNHEFDKAAAVYESIVSEFPSEAEGYWGIVLCRYGIEYVDDPGTGRKVPTCHRLSYKEVLSDGDFEMAMEYADPDSRRLYREEAKEIERIREGILSVSAKEEPYDIFISYKETDDSGNRTLDSVIAQDVYDALTRKGYRVFFSRVSLEDKLGQEYEPYIFAALNSAKVMLVFGTDYEYFNAVWVKNEWSRYLMLMQNDPQKFLIPCYRDIDAYDMPSEFRRLQAQDMGKIGAVQDLLRGIEKLIGSKAQSREDYIKELERKLAGLQAGGSQASRVSGSVPAQNPAVLQAGSGNVEEYIRRNFNSNTKIKAVKYYREQTGADLRTAVHAVDAIFETEQKPAGQTAVSSGIGNSAGSSYQALKNYILEHFSDSPIKAIKYYREQTGAGLADGKAAVDRMFEEKKKEDLANSSFSPVPLTMQGISDCFDNNDQAGAVNLIMNNYGMEQKEAERYCKLFYYALNEEHYPLPDNKSMNVDDCFIEMKQSVFNLDKVEKECLKTYEREKDSRPAYCAERMEYYRSRVKYNLERIDYYDKRIRKACGLDRPYEESVI